MKKYQKVPIGQGHKFYKMAEDWFVNAPNSGHFHDCQSSAIRAVAEYLANQQGYTLFTN